ncbi:MAG: hypothetical protein ACI9UU_001174 [Candidatus Azotimanducaceae bacterium]|jgi:hypothetical protein
MQKALQAIPNEVLRDMGCGNSTLSEKLGRH